MKNNLYYIEAYDINELFIKLDWIKTAVVMIQDYVEEEKETDTIEALSKANLKQIPILWIMPKEKKSFLSHSVSRHFTDILLSPFDSSTLLRKVTSILQIEEDMAKIKQRISGGLNLPTDHSDQIVAAMELAVKGGYPLNIIRMQVKGAHLELNIQLLHMLTQTLRVSDQVIETGLGEFIILCPFTPLSALNIVEAKIQDAVTPIVQNANSAYELRFCSTNYPDVVQSYPQLESRLNAE